VRISVFGLGYVGAVSCACLPELGHEVIGVDTNAAKVGMINDGQSPVVESGIAELIDAAVRTSKLSATVDLATAIERTDVSLISVATPAGPSYAPDLSAVDNVVGAIGAVLRGKAEHHTIVLRSTVPPGTTDDRIRPLLENTAGRLVGDRLSLIFNPEFLREGSSVRDFRQPPQTVIGSMDEAGYEVMARMYAGLPGQMVRTSCRVAESVKYVCNVFHAMKIVFANEVGSVLKACGLDSQEVMRIFCQDTQLNISPAYLRPGFAFGGSCLPKEVKGFLKVARDKGVSVPTLGGLLESNSAHIESAYNMIAQEGRVKVAMFGLAFKPGTDDMRDSPMVALAERLMGRGFTVSIYDNFVELSRLLGKNREFIDREIPHLDRLLKATPEDALEGAEIAVVGHADAYARHAIVARAPQLRIVDLCGYADLRVAPARKYEGICW
jgi:GDP-mannose 6-dehydrogenase